MPYIVYIAWKVMFNLFKSIKIMNLLKQNQTGTSGRLITFIKEFPCLTMTNVKISYFSYSHIFPDNDFSYEF